MKKYSDIITLSKNSRGIWDLDTVKGCKSGASKNKNGCYGSCYASSIARRYGYDFSNSTIRRFTSKKHLNSIIKKIEYSDADFIRIGVTGDPSECWEHTIDVCKKIEPANKPIVIITKHWETIPKKLYKKIESIKIVVNTSVSALDNFYIDKKLKEYNKLKSICCSCLRIVSCNFNIKTELGRKLNSIQEYLFNNSNIIDTVFRPNKNHNLVKQGVIITENRKFMSSMCLSSVYKEGVHMGYCNDCPEKCGLKYL